MKKTLIIHNPVFRLLTPPIIGLFSYLLILLFYNDFSLFVTFFTGQELYVNIGISYLILELGRIGTLLGERFYSYAKYQSKSIIVATALILFLTSVIVSLIISLYFSEVQGFSISQMQLMVFNGTFLSFALLYQLFYYGLYFMNVKNEDRLKEELEKNEGVREAAIRFTNEINPDMLYDSLESLIILSRKNPDEADEFINDLSSIYRYILSNKQAELIDLDNEIQMTEKMVNLLNHKYHQAIIFRSKVPDEDLEIQLIPGTLPKIVERVIENSIVSPSFPLMIQCEFDNESGYIELKYPLNEKLVKKDSKILEEIQRSYGFLTDKPVVHVKAYEQGYIKIPALSMNMQYESSHY